MIRLSGDDDVRVIALDRPERRNALTPTMLDALNDAIGRCAGARAVVLVGEGAAFCAGFDLKLCADDPSGRTLAALLTGLSEAVRGLRALQASVVVGVHGAAIAGGAALLGGGDVVASEAAARIGYPVVKIGVSPAVSAPFLAASVGGGGVRERLLDPELINGARAREIGLVHELVDADVRARAMEIAHTLAGKPRGGMVATKRWVDEIHDSMGPLRAEAGMRALGASLSIVGNDEERERMGSMWGKGNAE